MDGAKLSLPTKNIYHVGKNAITVKNNQAVLVNTEKKDCFIVPISSKAYSINGEFLGVIKEMTFDNRFAIQKIFLDNNEALEVKNILTIGKNVVVFSTNNEGVKHERFSPPNQPKLFREDSVQNVTTLPVTIDSSQATPDQFKVQSIQDLDFLVGRICTKDIFNFNNELLIKAHSIIKKKNIKEIKKFGKLRELMIYSK